MVLSGSEVPTTPPMAAPGPEWLPEVEALERVLDIELGIGDGAVDRYSLTCLFDFRVGITAAFWL